MRLLRTVGSTFFSRREKGSRIDRSIDRCRQERSVTGLFQDSQTNSNLECAILNVTIAGRRKFKIYVDALGTDIFLLLHRMSASK